MHQSGQKQKMAPFLIDVKKMLLEMVIVQQMNKEAHDQNYYQFLHLTFYLFTS